jgi:hypothetical protein
MIRFGGVPDDFPMACAVSGVSYQLAADHALGFIHCLLSSLLSWRSGKCTMAGDLIATRSSGLGTPEKARSTPAQLVTVIESR